MSGVVRLSEWPANFFAERLPTWSVRSPTPRHARGGGGGGRLVYKCIVVGASRRDLGKPVARVRYGSAGDKQANVRLKAANLADGLLARAGPT